LKTDTPDLAHRASVYSDNEAMTGVLPRQV